MASARCGDGRGWRVAVVLGCALSRSLAAQGTPQGSSFQLHGTVVDGKTGKPLARALVTTGDRRLATMTGNDGQFALEVENATSGQGAPAVQPSTPLGLVAIKPGYLRRGAEVLVSLADPVASQNVVLKMMPAVSIAGHVTTPDNDGPRNVQVQLLRKEGSVNGQVWMRNDVDRTDGHGAFHFDGLAPGDYTVVTGMWRDGEEAPLSVKEVSNAFPPTYNGDAARFESAQVLHLHYGDSAQLEIHLHPEPFYPVKVRVATTPGMMGIDTQFVGNDAFSSFELHYNAVSGVLEGALPTGTYDVVLQSQGKEPQSFASMALHVEQAPLVTGPVTLSPAGEIPVRVRTEFTGSGAPANARAYLSFSPLATGAPIPRDGDASRREYVIGNAPPGKFHVAVQVPYGYLASITSGGADLQREPLAVGPGGSAPIDIVLRDDTATIAGSVVHSDEPLPAHVWVAALATTNNVLLQVHIAEAQPDGTFTLPNLPPGSYRVFATGNPSAAALAYGQDDADRLGRKVDATTVAAGQKAQAEAPLLDDADLEAP